MPPTEEEREASTLDVASQQIFAMLDAFPRFKDLAADPMRPADQAADVRGCILFTGPLKMLQTVAMVTQAGKASTAPERFKPLLSRCKWLAADAILGELGSDAGGTEGLLERLRAHEPSSQYVFVLAAQVASGGLCCKHHTGTGSPGVADVGPCQYVMDHGRERVDRMPGFNYSGTLRPHRVTPDRGLTLPESILRPDYFFDGAPRAEARHPSRDNPSPSPNPIPTLTLP